MPQCYHHKGRGKFDPITTPLSKWAPSADHYPILKWAGGRLDAENKKNVPPAHGRNRWTAAMVRKAYVS